MLTGGSRLWEELLPQGGRAPSDRYRHACCSYDGHVYVLGGRERRALRDFWRYSPVFDEWAELSCVGDAAPEELEGHSMVAHQGFLYVFGGLLDSSYTRWRCALWVFDAGKQKWVQWQRKAGRPQSWMPTTRKGHSAVLLGSAMLLYGGFVDIQGSSKEFCRLDLDSMLWSALPTDSGGPGPRHGHSAVSYQGCMYLYGGLKGLEEQKDLWRWTSRSNTWTALRNRAGPPRLMGHSAVTYRGSMLLFGGGQSQDAPNDCLWRYSFTTQTWSRVAAPAGSAPPAKIHHCCAGLGPGFSPDPPEDFLQDWKHRPFKNKCFPAPLSFLGSEGIELQSAPGEGEGEDIELQTFRQSSPEGGASQDHRGLTLENKGFRKQWSCSEVQDQDQDQDVAQHLPDLLLLLGGRPCSTLKPLSVWQVTL